MKKIIFLFSSVFLISLTSWAQKPVKGDNQIVLGLQSGTSGFAIFKHYYKDDMARRYGISPSINYSYSPSTISHGMQTQSHNSNIILNVSYGIQKSFEGLEKIEPYVGADVGIGYSTRNYYYKNVVVDTSGTSYYKNVGDYNIQKISGPGTLQLSFRPVVGFNYYIRKNFAVGMEYSFNLFYVSYAFAGKNISESQSLGVYKSDIYSNSPMFNIGSNFVEKLSLTVSYYFK